MKQEYHKVVGRANSFSITLMISFADAASRPASHTPAADDEQPDHACRKADYARVGSGDSDRKRGFPVRRWFIVAQDRAVTKPNGHGPARQVHRHRC